MTPYQKQVKGFRDEARLVRFAFICFILFAVVMLGALYTDLSRFFGEAVN